MNVVRDHADSIAAAAEAASYRAGDSDTQSTTSTAQTPVQKALAATSFPRLVPDVASLSSPPYVPEWVKDDCLNVSPGRVSKCVYGNPNGDRLAVVLGDSHASSYVPAIRKALDSNWRIQVLTFGQCPAAAVTVVTVSQGTTTGAPFPACNQHRTFAQEWVAQHRSDLLITTDAWDTIKRVQGASGASQQLAVYSQGVTESVKALAPTTKHLIELVSPPGAGDLAECQTRIATPANCAIQVSSAYQQFVAALTSGVTAADEKNVQVVSSVNWFCSNNRCPAFIGTSALYADGHHLTQTGSQYAGPLLRKELQELKDL
jgi:hypothetical protein